ncbi:glycosyltransferase [Flavobacterium fluviatile]|uniref:glycosyltransferase n=1 Tax=Flavobacterium fluviatile TaxID=1862387 RepID=UPI0013CFE26A|nr:glycosyltransferase [Flavobacterium fluviatile]
MELISIVVPVYNVEKYLHACIDSILVQTHKNIEVILVNDGSSDRSPQICDEYEANDTRIKVIHKKNGGASSARNVGMKIAQGQYIGFVDSDDIISPVMYEVLYSQIKKYDANVAHIKSTSKLTNLSIKKDVINSQVKIVEKNNLLCFAFDYLGVAQWSGLYKRDVLDGCFFVEGALNEDILWSYNVRKRSNRLLSIDLPLYYWNLEPVSLSRSGISTLENPYDYIQEDLINSQSDEQTLLSCKMKSIEFDFRSVTRSTIHGFKTPALEKKYKENEKQYIKNIRQNLGYIIRSPLFTKTVKAQLILLSISPSVYKLLRNTL